jgi:hypothetical protein
MEIWTVKMHLKPEFLNTNVAGCKWATAGYWLLADCPTSLDRVCGVLSATRDQTPSLPDRIRDCNDCQEDQFLISITIVY